MEQLSQNRQGSIDPAGDHNFDAQETCLVDQSLLEQYKILLTMVNDEWSRFYTRQSIYLGIQMVGFAGIMSGFSTLQHSSTLLRFALAVLSFVSLMTALIATRGVTTQVLFSKIVVELEQRSGGKLFLLSIGQKRKRITLGLNFILSLILAWGLLGLWVTFIFIYAL